MKKDNRQKKSIRVFNEYVNELISEYQTTGKVNYEELARKHSCCRLPRNRFFAMHLDEVTRCLNTEETERIWEYIRNPKNTEAPIFSNVLDDAASSSQPIVEFQYSFGDTNKTSEDNDNTNVSWWSNFVSNAKDKITQLFVRDKVDGYYMLQATTPDGDDVFGWVNQHRRIDYVLRMRDKEIIEHGAVKKDDDLKHLNFERLRDSSQSFRAALALKTLLAEAERKNAINGAKLYAIAEILLHEEDKL
jgi:hypothetical protein